MPSFAIVRANVTSQSQVTTTDFVEWWATEHQPEFLAMPGFRRAWLGALVDTALALGEQGQRYMATYEVDDISDFNAALAAGPPWGEWQQYVDDWLTDWTRTYRTIGSQRDNDADHGRYWAVVASEFALSEQLLPEFRAWYDDIHLPELLNNPGFHRAWRLELEPDVGDLGPRGNRFWAIYEVDDPAQFVAARQKRTDAGIEPWDGIWTPFLTDWSISFFEVINRITKQDE